MEDFRQTNDDRQTPCSPISELCTYMPDFHLRRVSRTSNASQNNVKSNDIAPRNNPKISSKKPTVSTGVKTKNVDTAGKTKDDYDRTRRHVFVFDRMSNVRPKSSVGSNMSTRSGGGTPFVEREEKNILSENMNSLPFDKQEEKEGQNQGQAQTYFTFDQAHGPGRFLGWDGGRPLATHTLNNLPELVDLGPQLRDYIDAFELNNAAVPRPQEDCPSDKYVAPYMHGSAYKYL